MRWRSRATRPTLLADLCSRKTDRIRRAVFFVGRTRHPEQLASLVDHLDLIERRTRGLGVVATMGLSHALERIRMFRDGVCLCAAYPRGHHYNPAKEAKDGHVRIVEEVPVVDENGVGWPPVRVCECTGCGRRFAVHDREYHAPWWQWDASPPT